MTVIDHDARAGALWPILVEAAANRRQLTYKQAGERVGIHHRAMRYALGPIQAYCLETGLPRLTAIVYGKMTGVPGAGFAGVPGDQTDMQDVWEFHWSEIANPFSLRRNDELMSIAEEIVEDPHVAAPKYFLQLSRGDQQRVFRKTVLKAYNYQCAICETSFQEVLEAAHIVPFGDVRTHLRIDPRNGICLCANHHKLFDFGWINISPDYRIEYADENPDLSTYSPSDRALSLDFHGRAINLPEAPYLHPKRELLEERLFGSA